MWRGISFHALFVVLLALQVALPPAWVKYGLDCALRCRLAATTNAHCPLQYGAQQNKSGHRCHDNTATPTSSQLRCHSSSCTTSPSTLEVARFVVPHAIIFTISGLVLPRVVASEDILVDAFVIPPDPPPRSLALIAL